MLCVILLSITDNGVTALNDNKNILIHRIFSILISIFAVIAGICFIAGCLSIYFSGEQPYTAESIAKTFNNYCIPVYIFTALAAIGILLDIFMPAKKSTQPTSCPHYMALNRMQKKHNPNAENENITVEIGRLRIVRRRLQFICLGVSLVCAAVFLGYTFNGSLFYKETINDTVISAMYVLLPCLAVSFAVTVFTNFKILSGMRKELELLKKCPKRKEADEKPTNTSVFPAIRATVLIAALALLVCGFVSGGTADVLTKAINICTECIGLG